jgi:hypothetical protein
MLKLAAIFKATDALLDLAGDLFDLLHIVLAQVDRKLVKKRPYWWMMRLQQCGHIVFIETHTRKPSSLTALSQSRVLIRDARYCRPIGFTQPSSKRCHKSIMDQTGHWHRYCCLLRGS